MALTTTDRLLDDVVAVTLPDEGAGLAIGGRCYPVQGMSIHMARKMAMRIRTVSVKQQSSSPESISTDAPARIRAAEPGVPAAMTAKHWHDPQAMG